ncbi:MAG: hypothetical protein HYR84_04840, partial [Planctomycetes bacterium]|nr:hypothetical protein [Planctomycetota bacterium]
MENHQRLIFWTGGKQENANGCAQKARGIPFLPAPTPLRRAAIVVFLWGGAEFEMVVSAGSLRNTLWGDEEI